jgi:hypothetical protein
LDLVQNVLKFVDFETFILAREVIPLHKVALNPEIPRSFAGFVTNRRRASRYVRDGTMQLLKRSFGTVTSSRRWGKIPKFPRNYSP